MDKKENPDTKSRVFFPCKKNRLSRLKNILQLIKSHDRVRSPSFSHVNKDGYFIESLTIKENIYLDSIPRLLSCGKDFQLRKHIYEKGNEALSRLVQKIPDLELRPAQVDKQTLKMAALIKAFLKDGSYLILEYPELHLSEQNLGIFLDSLEFLSLTKNIIVRSDAHQLWSPWSAKTIAECEKGLLTLHPTEYYENKNSRFPQNNVIQINSVNANTAAAKKAS